MNITIVGAGHAGTTVASDLTLKGHNVTLLKTSKKLHNEHYTKLIETDHKVILEEGGRIQEARLSCVTTDFKLALNEAELVILYVQTNYHENIIKRMEPYLKDGQIILIEPGYLSTLYFKKYCADKKLIIVEAESSPIDCRIEEPGRIKVFFRNVRNPIGVYPPTEAEKVLDRLKSLEYNFILVNSVIEAALHNPNLIVHTVGALLSIPRIEYTKGEYWMYREVFTPHIWNIVKALDNEKMNVLEKLGCEKVPYVEACKIRNSFDLSCDATEVFFDYANHHSPKGPSIPDSRYLTEDIPEGLVLLESIGQIVGVQTPTCTGLINIANAALTQDFRKEGRSVQRLGKEIFLELIEEHCVV